MTEIRRFEEKDHAVLYAQFRPCYPKAVVDQITSYMKKNGCSGFEHAVDVCCGSGQSTSILCEYFDKVSGYDISQEQILQAQSVYGGLKPQFNVGNAHDLPIESSSVDLLTCALGWHWLDAERFYAECKRLLKPKGCIAVYGYSPTVTDNKHIGKALAVFKQELMNANCITDRIMLAYNNYKDVVLPFSQTERLEFDLPQKVSMDHLLGYMTSVSSYRAYCKKFPENNLLNTIRKTYENESGASTSTSEEFTYPGFLVIGMNE